MMDTNISAVEAIAKSVESSCTFLEEPGLIPSCNSTALVIKVYNFELILKTLQKRNCPVLKFQNF